MLKPPVGSLAHDSSCSEKAGKATVWSSWLDVGCDICTYPRVEVIGGSYMRSSLSHGGDVSVGISAACNRFAVNAG